MSENLSLWESVQKTDPIFTKEFSGKGGFSGTAISPMWLIRRATEVWGPMGDKWGISILSENVLDGIGGDKLHVVCAQIWYPGSNNTRGTIPCYGQTQLCGMRKDGKPYLDEEAPKKSLTDALTKGLSWLGFAADVHMGLFDDVKYVAQVKQEFDAAEAAKQQRAQHDAKEKAGADNGLAEKSFGVLESVAPQGMASLELTWKTLSGAAKKAVQAADPERYGRLKKTALAADAKIREG